LKELLKFGYTSEILSVNILCNQAEIKLGEIFSQTEEARLDLEVLDELDEISKKHKVTIGKLKNALAHFEK
jgi:hypothetical protein